MRSSSEAGERREHQRAVDAELVHQLEARRRLAERGDAPHRLADDLAVRLALRVAVAEVLLLRARPRDDLERRVRDVLADLAAHDDLRAAPHLDVVDRALVPVREVPGERVLGLVQVVVGVEDEEVECVRAMRHTLRGFLTVTSRWVRRPESRASASSRRPVTCASRGHLTSASWRDGRRRDR